MSRIELEWISVYDLKPYENNPRVNHQAVAVVAASIEKHGFIQPIMIDQHNTICAGHTRWEAAKSLKMMKIPCIRKEMNEKQFIDFNLTDNKSHQLSKWDKEKLKFCMEMIDDIEAVKCAGFNDSEIDKIFGHSHSETHSTEADFGDSGSMDDTEDPDAIEVNMKFVYSKREHNIVSSKLKAIKKEHGLPSLAHALIKALDGFKASSGPRLRKGGS